MADKKCTTVEKYTKQDGTTVKQHQRCSVKFSSQDYERSHGAKPKGAGAYAFQVSGKEGKVNEVIFTKFASGVGAARKQAKTIIEQKFGSGLFWADIKG